jgi:putative ABC transport system permease protein
LRSRITPGELRELESVLEQGVSPMLMGLAAVGGGQRVPVLGVTAASYPLIPVVAGRVPRDDQPELMMGVLYAQASQKKVGAPLRLGSADYTVVGLYRSGSRFIDGGVVTGVERARQVLGRSHRPDDYNMALVHTGDQAESARVVALVQRHFPQLRAQPTAEFSGVLQIMRTMQLTSWTIAAIALFGAAIVVANTLVMVVAERTAELGVLMAIGWSPWLVLRMLGAESLVLCLIGVLLGNAAAQGLLSLLARVHPEGQGWSLPLTVAPSAVVASFAAAGLIALLALAWPAHVVYRIRPADALRHA